MTAHSPRHFKLAKGESDWVKLRYARTTRPRMTQRTLITDKPMNQLRLLLRAQLLSGAFLLLGNAVAHAGSATWKTQPPSTTWNDAANWIPATVPNGPADTATFATSQRRTITPNEPTEVNSIVFSPGGALFTITSGVGAPLTISGTGIVNNSGL